MQRILSPPPLTTRVHLRPCERCHGFDSRASQNFSFSLGIVDVSPLFDALQVEFMAVGSSARRLSKSELESVHKSLIEITRKQKSQDSPVEIAMPEGLGFWDAVGQLLLSMEAELSETVRDEGMTAKAQLLSRRLGVARTCVTDLTRMRLTAFTRHAVMTKLLISGKAQLPSNGVHRLEWSRHDPSERVFYNGIRDLSEKYKVSTSWSTMLGSFESDADQDDGVAIETLKEFTEETVDMKPQVSTRSEEAQWKEPDFDEEDRIRDMDVFPEHASSTAESRSLEEREHEDPSGLVRIKVLKEIEDPILMEDGSEIILEVGDIEFCQPLIAEILISAGFAEAAPV